MPRPPSASATGFRCSARPRLLLALFLTVLSASALLLNLSGLRDRQEGVRRMNTVLTTIAELHEAVRGAETGQRGYLLTNEARYLATYEAALPRVWQHLKTAETLAQDPGQASRIASLRPLIQAKLDELAETVALRALNLDAALQVVRSDRGQDLMEQIDATMRSIRDRGTELVARNSARERQDTAWSTIAAGLTGGLALISAVLGVDGPATSARPRAPVRGGGALPQLGREHPRGVLGLGPANPSHALRQSGLRAGLGPSRAKPSTMTTSPGTALSSPRTAPA